MRSADELKLNIKIPLMWVEVKILLHSKYDAKYIKVYAQVEINDIASPLTFGKNVRYGSIYFKNLKIENVVTIIIKL